MRLIPVLATAVLLAGCGGEAGGGGGGSEGERAAAACEATAKTKLDGKDYSVDLTALATSMKANPDGTQFLKGPIVIEPGLTSETKQIIECTVRFTEGKPEPDVINFVFNW